MKKDMQVVELDEKVVLVDREFGGSDVCTIRQLFTDYGIDLYFLPEEDEVGTAINGTGCRATAAHETNYGYLRLCE